MIGASFLATLCLLLTAPSNGVSRKRRKKNEDSAYERKRTCQADTCGHLVPLEASNCVNECVSADCYHKTFTEPLEDGEVNVQLSKNFMACARRETKSTAFTQKRSRLQQQQAIDKQNAAKSGSKPGVVARKASAVHPKGGPGDINAADFFSEDKDNENLAEQDLEQDFRSGEGGVDSEEDEDFDEEYEDEAM